MEKYTSIMADFKNNLSDENQKVIAILKDISEGYELETVLDIGSGLGDITANALPYHRVIHLDKEDYSQYPVAESHLREIDDIFSYVPKEKITTLLMCHVLQYIDDDRARLDQKIEDLWAEIIIITLNKNNDFMGKLIERSKENIPWANPEVRYADFPQNYVLQEELPYTGRVKAANREELVRSIICVLIDVSYESLSLDLQSRCKSFLQAELKGPEFPIHQSLLIYRRNTWK